MSYDKKLFIGIPVSKDAGDKLALIAMVSSLTYLLKQKRPGLDHYQVLRMITKDKCYSDDQIEAVAAICNWFAEGCTKFPDLGVTPKEIPAKVCSILDNLLPF